MRDTWGAAVETVRRWRHDAVAFVREALGVEQIEPWQLNMLKALPSVVQQALVGSKPTLPI